MIQEEKPLGTTERFNLTLLSTDTSKEQLVNELNDLVDQYHAVLVKVVPNQDNYEPRMPKRFPAIMSLFYNFLNFL